MTVYKNNRGKWCFDIEWVYPDGTAKRIRKTSPIQTKVGAEREERKVRDALSDGTYGVRAGEDVPTVAQYKDAFMDWCRGERHKPSGIESKEGHFRRYVLPLFGNKRLDAFGPEDQKRLRVRMAKLSESTYNGSASLLNKLLGVAKGEGQFSSEPFSFDILDIPERKMGFYDFGQQARMIKAAADIGVVAECVVLLGSDAGLRRGEMYRLTYDMCDLANGFVIIERAETVIRGQRTEHSTKGLNSRKVPLTSRLRDALNRCSKVTKGRVIVINGKPPTKASFLNLLSRVQKRAGLPAKGNAHVLRHTFCSHLAMRGVPVLTIKELAGHKKIETTLKYMHLAPGEKERAIASLELDWNGNLAATAAE